MYICSCGKEFESYRSLNGHKSIHREGGRYSVSRIKRNASTILVHYCINCKNEFKHSPTTMNKYCSNSCQKDFESKERIKKWLSTGDTNTVCFPAWAKRYLLESRGSSCEHCGISTWNSMPLVLECDHTDGNPYNNKIDNLRLLCPNCHSQTPSFKAKNKGNGRKHRYKKLKPT
jgi:Zn finger protein HypA/HybF involved in hydrogenase expression